MNTVKIWFSLVNSAGEPYKGANVDLLSVDSSAYVAEFRDAVKIKNSDILTGVSPSQLLLYRNKISFDNKEEPLKSSSSVSGLGSQEEDALIVVVPSIESSAAISTSYWRVSGTIVESLRVKGLRSRMYQNADNFLGYYEAGKQAFFYDENKTTLRINVLFKTEENALRFDSHLRNESISIRSPMNSLTINANVSFVTMVQLGQRIYYKEYIPTDSESPPDAHSDTTTQISTFEETSDEFKCQRIESFDVFGSAGKAETCHLMSSSHCKRYPSYEKYDNDPNNRLAMSRDLHGWFDGLNMVGNAPQFCLQIVSISDKVEKNDRFRVVLAVIAFSQEYANKIFPRLIEGSRKTDDPLVMHTVVYVTNPTIFQRCLEWKEKENRKNYNMEPAVP